MLVTDDGEETLRAGDAAGFPRNDANGHCFQNCSDHDAQILEIGTRVPDETAYQSTITDLVEKIPLKTEVRITDSNGRPYSIEEGAH